LNDKDIEGCLGELILGSREKEIRHLAAQARSNGTI
jgi:hypothetical protein